MSPGLRSRELREREANTHWKSGRHSPPLPVGLKNLAWNASPLASRFLAASRCASSIALFSSVAAASLFALMAAVTLVQRRRDSFGACWLSGATTFWTARAVLASNSVSRWRVCGSARGNRQKDSRWGYTGTLETYALPLQLH